MVYGLSSHSNPIFSFGPLCIIHSTQNPKNEILSRNLPMGDPPLRANEGPLLRPFFGFCMGAEAGWEQMAWLVGKERRGGIQTLLTEGTRSGPPKWTWQRSCAQSPGTRKTPRRRGRCDGRRRRTPAWGGRCRGFAERRLWGCLFVRSPEMVSIQRRVLRFCF